MNKLYRKQRGASVIALALTLAVIGYGAFVGINYAPQFIEASTVESILESMVQDHKTEAVKNPASLRSTWDKQLNVNQMDDLKDSIFISNYRGEYTITVTWERELDLLYEKKVMKYEKSVTLK